MTTTRPASGPTDRSMPPVSITISWPSAMNPSALASSSMLTKLNSVRKRSFEADV